MTYDGPSPEPTGRGVGSGLGRWKWRDPTIESCSKAMQRTTPRAENNESHRHIQRRKPDTKECTDRFHLFNKTGKVNLWGVEVRIVVTLLVSISGYLKRGMGGLAGTWSGSAS